MAFNIGVNVVETEGTASPAIAGAPTSVAGFIVRSRRGPVDKAVRVSNFRQFTARFGRYHKGYLGAYCLDGFFLNGGREAYIARVVESGDDVTKAASVTLKDRATSSQNILQISAGYRGQADPGSWGNNLSIDIEDNPTFSTPLVTTLAGNQPARLQGSDPGHTKIDLSPFTDRVPRTLPLEVDGETLEIAFNNLPVSSQATLEDIVNAINAQANGQVKAFVDNSTIQLVSRSKGSQSNLEILQSTYDETRERLGFPDGNTTEIGKEATMAQLKGEPIAAPINLGATTGGSAHTLTITIDDSDSLTIDFSTLANNANAPVGSVAKFIDDEAQKNNYPVKVEAIEINGSFFIQLTSTSKAIGAASKIEIGGNDITTLQALGFRIPINTAAEGEDSKAAQLSGNAIAAQLDLSPPTGSPPRIFKIKLDNSETLTIDFGQLPADQNKAQDKAQVPLRNIINTIEAQTKQKVTAEVITDATTNASHIQLTSNSGARGADSKIEVLTDAAHLLGFSNGTSISGSPSAAASYIEAQIESWGQDALKEGDWIRLDDGLTQNWHQIKKLEPRKNPQGKLQYFVVWDAPQAKDENEYRIEDKATLSTCEFDLSVRLKEPQDAAPKVVETWERLTLDSQQPNYACDQINDQFSGSAYIVLKDLKPGSFASPDIPKARREIPLVKGKEGSEPSISDYKNALSRFDAVDIQLLAVTEAMPDDMLRAVSNAAISYCGDVNGKGDCLFVGHTPEKYSMQGAKAFGQNLRASKVYGALYWPWITVTDPIGKGANPTKTIPPTGHVLGAYARIDQTRGVWKAPAGNEAVLRGALAVKADITDRDHTELVKNGSVNGIRQIKGAGIVIDASRTLSTDPRWLYVNVRLLFNYVKASLREGLRWVKQEPNRENLWNKIKYNTVTPFLQRLYQAGAFGPGTPEDVFTIVCSAENNTPKEIQLGNLKVEVYFYPGRPAETIIITVGQQDSSGATASEQ